MIIKRIVNGVEQSFELTHSELLEAHSEMQEKMDWELAKQCLAAAESEPPLCDVVGYDREKLFELTPYIVAAYNHKRYLKFDEEKCMAEAVNMFVDEFLFEMDSE